MNKKMKRIIEKSETKQPLTKKEAQQLATYHSGGITFNRAYHPAAGLKKVFDYSKATPEERKAFFDAKHRRSL